MRYSLIIEFQDKHKKESIQMSEQKDGKFCFAIVREKKTLTLACVYICFLYIFLIFLSRQFIKHQLQGPRTITKTTISFIYFLLFIWNFFCLIEASMSIGLYFDQTHSKKVEFFLFFFAFATMFLLHTAIMYALYHWNNNFLMYIQRVEMNQSMTSEQIHRSTMLREKSIDSKLRKFIKYYQIVRQMVLFIWAIAIFAIGNADDNDAKLKIGVITIVMVLIDSVALFVISCIGFCLLHTNKKVGQLLKYGALKTIETSYFFLLICSICRVLIYSIRTWVSYLAIRLDEDCYKQPKTQEQQDKATCLFLILFVEAFIIDFLSASNILGFYNQFQTEQYHQNEVLDDVSQSSRMSLIQV